MIIISGSKKLFYVVIKMNRKIVIMVGVSRCSIIVEKIWSFFVLLIWVVLRSFIGIDELV